MTTESDDKLKQAGKMAAVGAATGAATVALGGAGTVAPHAVRGLTGLAAQAGFGTGSAVARGAGVVGGVGAGALAAKGAIVATAVTAAPLVPFVAAGAVAYGGYKLIKKFW